MPKQTTQLASDTLRDSRWLAVTGRDATRDGDFYYAVKTTGVYCRPSCGARTPRPENVQFFTTPDDAEQAGFRACKRCRPRQAPLTEQYAELIADLCRHIEQADTPPSLAQLAELAQLSTFHLHRIFKAITGITPKAYATAHRSSKVRQQLSSGSNVTEAMYAAGYNSNGRFYAESDQMLGMKPAAFRSGGTKMQIHFAVGECSLGAILVAASERGICAILMGDDAQMLIEDLQNRFAKADFVGGDTAFEQWVAQVVGFVDMPKLGLNLPLDISGSVFQQRVWQALREIPVGSTASYSEIARQIGQPKSARAVAQACAANPLAVAIPCHRVVRNDGGLSGYRWGIERKRALLECEAKT
ncbi:bifunctional DNA-binding transcriptional regulator/O6-methylguanine-DNA methyltransferase Ada [Deefgea rivuli]|uniref:bifunctional DNA-binding transcriptional regulator/O6-methylguanine-DNA methyltransferase Ada n=1 Tax=Deefgea rivuli TaxID=400948 RepID=UPI000481EEA1|nr:bifunctional DNA-binding transcriptional regulator/O6-methylguanine-DNA methyltransferase Ada [Deefgea rivuli]